MLKSTTPAHFLLVEDEQAHADLVLMALEDNIAGSTTDHVSDGEQAMAYLRHEGVYSDAQPDVVLLDIKLPKLDGHEVLGQIKGDDALRMIPVVMLTTSVSETDRARAYARSANSFLAKPADSDDFQQMIRDLNLYWTVWNQPAGESAHGAA